MKLDTSASRRRHRREFILSSTFAVASLAAGLPAWGQSKAQKVRIGYIGDFNGTSLLAVANKLGLWDKHGLIPELKVFTNGPLQIQALGTSDLDFGYIGPGAMWLPMVGKAKISAINGQVTTGRLISQPGIDSINGLKGKTIAVTQGTTGDAVVRLALKSARMELGDVKIVSMDPSTIVTAFSSGQVDAAGLWYPLVDTVRARVPKLQELYTDKDANFLTCFVTQPDIAQRSPELLMATNRVFREANDWRHSNIPAAIDLVADMLKIPKAPLVAEASVHAKYFSTAELDKLTADGTIGSWLRGTNEMFKEFGRVGEIVDPNKYYLGAQYTAARA